MLTSLSCYQPYLVPASQVTGKERVMSPGPALQGSLSSPWKWGIATSRRLWPSLLLFPGPPRGRAWAHCAQGGVSKGSSEVTLSQLREEADTSEPSLDAAAATSREEQERELWSHFIDENIEEHV